MSANLKSAIATAKSFVATAAYKDGADDAECSVLERMRSWIPSSFVARHGTKYTSPLLALYCLQLLSDIHTAFQSQEEVLLGSQDMQIVRSLLELVISCGIEPYVGDGVGLPFERRKISKLIEPAIVRDTSEFAVQNELGPTLHRINDFLSGKSFVTGLIKTSFLSGVTAGMLVYSFDPKYCFDGREQAFELFAQRIEPHFLLSSLSSMLHAACPPWLKKLATHRMSLVLTRSQGDGLRYVASFVLQSDESGKVSFRQFELLANLVSTVPRNMTIQSYLDLLGPQLLTLLDEINPESNMLRAIPFIIARLLARYADESQIHIISTITESLQRPENVTDAALERCLARLATLTLYNDTNLITNLLDANILAFVRVGFAASRRKLLAIRDMSERLINRYVRSEDTPEHLHNVICIISTLSRDQYMCVTNSKPTLDNIIEYGLRILDQVKTVPGLIRAFFFESLDRLTGTCTDFDSLLLFASLQEQIPKKFLRIFLDELDPTLQSILAVLQKEGPSENKPYKIGSDDTKLQLLLSILNLVKEILPSGTSRASSGVLELLESALNTLSRESVADISNIAAEVVNELHIARLTRSASENHNAVDKSTSDAVRYQMALRDMGDEIVPVRAHGLYLVNGVIGVSPNIIDIPLVTKLMLRLLRDEDRFVYFQAAKSLRLMIDTFDIEVVSILVQHYQSKLSGHGDDKKRLEMILSESLSGQASLTDESSRLITAAVGSTTLCAKY